MQIGTISLTRARRRSVRKLVRPIRSRDRLPLRFPSPRSHPRRQPGSFGFTPPPPDPDRPVHCASAPRQSAPCGWPALPPPACAACAPSSAPSHDPSGAPFRSAHFTTAAAPMISRRRMSRWPIFEVLPSRSLPPLECWRGVRPTQAAKSRPLAKVSQGGAKVVIAEAVIVPDLEDPAHQPDRPSAGMIADESEAHLGTSAKMPIAFLARRAPCACDRAPVSTA
jgi:hypothetical protein